MQLHNNMVKKFFISIIIHNCDFRIKYFRTRGPVLRYKSTKKKKKACDFFFQPYASVSRKEGSSIMELERSMLL